MEAGSAAGSRAPRQPGQRTLTARGHGYCTAAAMLDTRAQIIPIMRLFRPPPIRNLRAFCIAARRRSFKFAADELCLTPSAVSHQMKELEAALGVRLFVRK